ncbi:MAG TPA: DUF5916 domain-containing protein, partial [Thermoanaerobaculia bacterium]|nr:DUF5916 domain-containing protein [Thermoanaerobaculia bacterium]
RGFCLGVLSCALLVDSAKAQNGPDVVRPTAQATRIETTEAPVIDADLSDAAWQSATEITGFTQHDPDDGKPATQKSIVKIVYTDEAIYFGARLEDTGKVTTLLGRRDNDLESDWFRVSIDSQHDRLSGAHFWVNPSNVQIDMILYNDIYNDWSWDAVWESAAKTGPNGWIAEMRIPYSQLRFTNAAAQTWGINISRRIARNRETDWLVNTPKGEIGFVSHFADLAGIDGIKPDRTFEIVPYAVARSDVATRFNRADPFARGSAYRMDGGMDVKYGLTSNLTLTGTINPDFGQVEVDPAVVNLTQFETFFPEKRPFFTEGSQMFVFSGPSNSRWNFNFSSPTYFYSRRIGRSPQGALDDTDYAVAPGETTILGAAKLTGKFGKGWSIGVLDALTDNERALTFTGGLFERRSVEPMTNYLVARSTKEYGKASRVGVLFSSVTRRLDEDLAYLRNNAYLGGIDGYTYFGKDKKWLLEWLGSGTMVEGSPDAIARTQKSAARYYQRPDAEHVELDPTRTSLTGFSTRAMLGKQTGVWRPNLQIQAYSPGFEMNDVGFMQRTDMITTHAVLHYSDEKVRKYTRAVSAWIGKYQNWNFDHDQLANGLHSSWSVDFKNYWYSWGWAGIYGPRFDDRRTRGGPLMRRPTGRGFGLGGGTDSRKKVQAELWTDNDHYTDGGFFHNFGLWLNYKPTTSVRLSITPTFQRSRELSQYVATQDDPSATATYGKRYIFSTIEQRTLDVGVRAEWTASSRLSFQLYLQPFVASADYHGFKELTRPRTREFRPYESIAYLAEENSYRANSVTFANPDFNFRSVKGNAVVRWEFRPGSALYVVWNENRSDDAIEGDFRFRRDLRAIPNAPSRDVFLVKISYWLPM